MDAQTELFSLIKAGDATGVARLLKAEPKLAAARDSTGVSALLTALYYRQNGIAEQLRRDHPGCDLFEAAALGDLIRLDELLRDAPQLVDTAAADGFTALHLAAFFARLEAAALLIARGAAVDSIANNPMRVRPLHSAAASRSTATLALVLTAGAEVNARQHGGFTALHEAARSGNEAMVRLLLARGADRKLRTDDGKDAWDLARAGDHQALQTLLG